ncbi:hypothetical protein HDZ31DRAFT_36647 [Schizophyllum fasciatum]
MPILRDSPLVTILCAKCQDSFSVKIGTPDFILRALTDNTPLGPDEIAAHASGIVHVREKLSQCDQEIAQLNWTLYTLRQVRAAIATTVDSIQALLAPVRKIPFEILTEIASYTLPSRWFEDRIGRHPWNFSQVCRSWRNVALELRWPWAHIRLPGWPRVRLVDKADMLSEAVSAYLRRTGETPWSLKAVRKSHLRNDHLRDTVVSHAERLCMLDVTCRYRFPFNCSFPALRRLTIRKWLSEDIDAPNLSVIEMYDCSTCTFRTAWGSLRGLKLCGSIYAADLEILRQCTRLEVLSLTDDSLGLDFTSRPLVLPLLHTLEIGSAAVEVCPHLEVPALRHFILNMASDDHVAWHVALEPPLSYLTGILPPVTSLTLRNVDDYDFENIPVLDLITVPRRLQRLAVVVETEYPLGTSPLMYRELVEVMCQDSPDTTVPHLTELELTNGAKDYQWSDEEMVLLRRLLETRGKPSANGVPRLGKLRVRTPFAVFPAPLLAEPWADARGSDGSRILDFDVRSYGVPIKAFDVMQGIV